MSTFAPASVSASVLHFTIITADTFSAFGFVHRPPETLHGKVEATSKANIPSCLLAEINEQLEKTDLNLSPAGFTASTSSGICICRYRSLREATEEQTLALLEEDVEITKALELVSRVRRYSKDPVTSMMLGAQRGGYVDPKRALGTVPPSNQRGSTALVAQLKEAILRL